MPEQRWMCPCSNAELGPMHASGLGARAAERLDRHVNIEGVRSWSLCFSGVVRALPSQLGALPN
jgi:hypothetical protein